MADQQLLQYITSAKEKNIPETQIKQNLLNAGWKEGVINDAFNSTSSIPVPQPPSQQTKSDYSWWDAFEHILLFISMYVFALFFTLTLLFIIDHYLPKIETYPSTYGQVYNNMKYDMLRGFMAPLIVSYPIFVFLFLDVTSRTLKSPYLRSLRLRKFLIYLTLVITFVISLINITATVSSFLNGNLTINWICNFLTIITVCSTIFFYYFFQIKGDRERHA